MHMPTRLQLDLEYASRLSMDLCDKGGVWERRQAVPELGSELPDEPGLYLFVWTPTLRLKVDGKNVAPARHVLYAGMTDVSLRRRFAGEYKRLLWAEPKLMWTDGAWQSRQGRLGAYLSVLDLEYWWLPYASPHVPELADDEKRIIKYFNPPLNDKDRYRAEIAPPRKAF